MFDLENKINKNKKKYEEVINDVKSSKEQQINDSNDQINDLNDKLLNKNQKLDKLNEKVLKEKMEEIFQKLKNNPTFDSKEDLLINNYKITEDDFNIIGKRIMKYNENEKLKKQLDEQKREREQREREEREREEHEREERERKEHEREERERPPDVKKRPPDVKPRTKKSPFNILPPPQIGPPGPPPQRKDYFKDRNKITKNILIQLIDEIIRAKDDKSFDDELIKIVKEMDKKPVMKKIYLP